MELPPQSVAGLDKPIAGQEKHQSQSNEDQICHFNSSDSFSNYQVNHSRINSVSRIQPKKSKKRQLTIRLKRMKGRETRGCKGEKPGIGIQAL
jgi:hypothetical protein